MEAVDDKKPLDWIKSRLAERIGGARFEVGQGAYKFEKIKRAKAEALAKNPKTLLLDMGIGEPDAQAATTVIESLGVEAKKPENRGYADNGCEEFLQAVAQYMHRVYGVSLERNEILHSMGSKAALSILAGCFVNPGDYAIMTIPGYAVLGAHAVFYGGRIYELPLKASNAYMPDLDAIPEEILKFTKVLVLNYPNNPTGAIATESFFRKAVAWAHQNHVILIQDAAYSALTFGSHRPLSLLSIPGAKEVALELHSLSKAFNMTGWRLGWVCGNSLLVRAYGYFKNHTDSGQFLAIQKAAIKALENPAITEQTAIKYERRLKHLAHILDSCGFKVQLPTAGFFLYTAMPKSAIGEVGNPITFSSAEQFSEWLLKEMLISTVPWDEVEPSIRFSVTFSTTSHLTEDAFFDLLAQRLGKYSFSF